MATEFKVFDPRDPATGTGGAELLDASVACRDGRWWMCLAGQAAGYGPTEIFSASLPCQAPLAATGWAPTRNAAGELAPLAGRTMSQPWDGNGGRHCPSYVRGWDPAGGRWVERIYYAGAADNLWGPYTIGFLEWDGERWVDQPAPAFTADEPWERGSVYEPNLVYHENTWKMWYAAGSGREDHLVHGYAESEDGRSGWKVRKIFASPEMRMFDFCVREHANSFHAVFARVWLEEGEPPPETGLWWCTSGRPSGRLADWSAPIQIMTAADCGWHKGPWKPSFQFLSEEGRRALVFFDGLARTSDPGPFPFVFTQGCLAVDLTVG